MASENRTVEHAQDIAIDFAYIIRCLKKNLYTILLCSIIVGVLGYVGTSLVNKRTYSSSIKLAVITRGGSNANLSANSVQTAVTRNVSVLNSDSLWTQMVKNAGELDGKISAKQITDTNLINLTAYGKTAYDSLKILKIAMDTYPELSGYFGSGYFLQQLNSFSVSDIQVEGRSSKIIALFIFLAVLMLGIGITGVYGIYSEKIHNLTQAEQLLDMPIISSLHFSKKKRGQKGILLTDKVTDISYAEEIDKLATSVQKKMERKNYTTLMVTSIYENEGKTTVAANIALALARHGKKVVLVDGDMRRPAVAKIFEYKNEEGKKGLSDFLAGNAEMRDVMVKNKDAFGLYQIYQLEAFADSDRLLAGEMLPKVIAGLGRAADYIIIDTAPVGVVQDAEILASMVDATLLVVRQDYTHASEINDAVDVLEDAGTNVLGGVLNMVKGERTAVGNIGKYGDYYHSYGKSER